MAVLDRKVTLPEKAELFPQVHGIFNVGSQVWTACYVEASPMLRVSLWLSFYNALFAEMVGLFNVCCA